jgi:hypothetical protein
MFFCTLPMVLRGKGSTTISFRGCLNRASDALTAPDGVEVGVCPGFRHDQPTTVSPKSGCGTPITALSSTPGCSSRISSISFG